jgi:phage repressor protein C with HTH and peptisase S24 domain
MMETKNTTMVDKKPKTEFDARVIASVEKVISEKGFKNDRRFLLEHSLSPSLLTKLRSGIQSAPAELVSIMVNNYQASLEYFQSGNGRIFATPVTDDQKSSAKAVGPAEPDGYAYLRFVPIVARATFAEMGDAPRVDEFDTIAVPIQPNDDLRTLGKCWVFEVNGDSMEETLHHGQRIVAVPVNEGDWEYQSDRVYVVSYAGYLVVKRIKTNDLRKHGYLELWSDNEKKGGMKVAQRREIKGIWKVLRLDRAPEIY